MVKDKKTVIMEELQKEKLGASKQALAFLYATASHGKYKELIKEFIKWYKNDKYRIVSGGDVLAFITQKRSK